jgi:hypothetical protein
MARSSFKGICYVQTVHHEKSLLSENIKWKNEMANITSKII